MDRALYILVRPELTKSQRIPQAAHAVAEFMGRWGQDEDVQDWLKNHRTMVCLQADEDLMGAIMDDFHYQMDEKRILPFFDDDFPEEFGWTAVALPPITRKEGVEKFGSLRLA